MHAGPSAPSPPYTLARWPLGGLHGLMDCAGSPPRAAHTIVRCPQRGLRRAFFEPRALHELNQPGAAPYAHGPKPLRNAAAWTKPTRGGFRAHLGGRDKEHRR